jgi:hypothetical protein
MTIVPLKFGAKLVIVAVLHADTDASMKAGRVHSLPLEAVLAGATQTDALNTPLRDVALYLAYEEEDAEFEAALLRALAEPESFIPWLRRNNPEPGRAWLAEYHPMPKSDMN